MSTVEIFRDSEVETRQADAATFVGSARTKRLAAAAGGVAVSVYRVEFSAGARTNWHTHSGPQWLLVVEGTIRVQCWGDRAHDVTAGDAVVIPPGEKHWHGAVPGATGTHLAVNVDVSTEWLEPVSDEQYTSEGGSRGV
jgi:quercetin dioxygenase-like cupin family protein